MTGARRRPGTAAGKGEPRSQRRVPPHARGVDDISFCRAVAAETRLHSGDDEITVQGSGDVEAPNGCETPRFGWCGSAQRMQIPERFVANPTYRGPRRASLSALAIEVGAEEGPLNSVGEKRVEALYG